MVPDGVTNVDQGSDHIFNELISKISHLFYVDKGLFLSNIVHTSCNICGITA